MEFEKEHGFIKIKGKYYELDERRSCADGKIRFKEAKDAKDRIKKAKEMANILKENLDRKAVLTESIMNLEKKQFDVLYKMLHSKRKYKAKTREHRCVDMKVGNFVIPLVD